MFLRFRLFIPLLLVQIVLNSQTVYPTDYFQSPLNADISLVGNFGEIRPNHFHAGFDIRTGGQEGLNVSSVADGYVSRIKISCTGYGNALYINHPNGYTSVYAHLQRYSKEIAALVKKIQYTKESFEIDTVLAPELLPVKKGQQVAFSGNSGSSSGPHLHFEIRNTKTEMPVNPYLFGYKVKDNVKPRITQLAIIPADADAIINGKHDVKKIRPGFINDKCTVSPSDTVTVCGNVGFGIECYDTESGSSNCNGVYSVELQVGGKRVYYHELASFSFANSRYVNTHICYPEKVRNNFSIQKCFLSKNNKLEIYKDLINGGVVNFKDDSFRVVKYIVKDFAGNTTEVQLKVKSNSKVKAPLAAKAPASIYFDCLKENKVDDYEIKLNIPASSLYDDIDFSYIRTLDVKAPYSPLFKIMTDEITLQAPYMLSIKAVKIADSLQKKACIVSINSKRREYYEGGIYKDGWVTTQAKSFGNFTIGIDNTPPRVAYAFTVPDYRNMDLTKARSVTFVATDDLSGVKKYRATIDDKWVLCEYDLKRDLLTYNFDENIKTGVHTFKIVVSDDKNNTTTLSFKFKR